MRKRLLAMTAVLLTAYCLPLTAAFAAEPLLIDDFEGASVNKLGGRASTYLKEPSRSLALLVKDPAHQGSGSLMLKYDKKGRGGPYDSGGWCGWYTLLKSGSRYFDASGYRSLTFWVRGAAGDENFLVGMADRHWDEVGDSVKSEPIGKYLPAGKVTAEWQKAVIPVEAFFLDHKQTASVAICFEGTLFPGGVGRGTVYLDDLKLE
ncbi:MAG: hypothetical protein HYS41_04510 [Candidatus Omnitrophica bacterium]|nr:hypothetical protein [Candidatus Omnitrophota bacterium]